MRYYPALFGIIAALTPVVRPAGALQDRRAAVPLVTIRQGAGLEESLAALQRSFGGVVAAELPHVQRRLATSLEEAGLEDALSEVARSFHLSWALRERSLVLQRRYGDPRELPSLETEAIRAITHDLYRLARDTCPYPVGVATAPDQDAFIASLSAEQREAMQASGLGFAGLNPAQRALWLKINTVSGFGSICLELARAGQMFAGWDQATLSRAPLADGSRRVLFQFPCSVEPDRRGGIFLNDVPKHVKPTEPARLGTVLPEHERRLPAPLRREVSFQVGGTTLGELAEELGRATGSKIAVPPYAAGRRLLLYAGTCTAEEVVVAVEDLFGYSFRVTGSNRYRLDRPPLVQPRSLFDVWQQARIALPPLAYHLWSDEGTRASAVRDPESLRVVLDEIVKRAGADWPPVRVAELSQEGQQRLVNILFNQQVPRGARDFVERPIPYWWSVAPELGAFTLTIDPEGQKYPKIRFAVRRPDGGEDAWGWFVGSSGPFIPSPRRP